MMKIFSLTAAMMAAVSFAVEASEDSDEPAATWNDMCFHCINEGNMFCVDTTQTGTANGTCMEANCKQQTDAEKKAKATCSLTQETLDTCKASDNKKHIVAFSECNYTKSENLEGCEDLVIT